MSPQLLRLVYAFEFLIALLAIFAAWSEIGGQAALDLMHWAWKLGLSLALAGAIVSYTAALVSGESLWTLQAARSLAIILIVVVAMGIVTYYYVLQEEVNEPEETSTVSAHVPSLEPAVRLS